MIRKRGRQTNALTQTTNRVRLDHHQTDQFPVQILPRQAFGQRHGPERAEEDAAKLRQDDKEQLAARYLGMMRWTTGIKA